MKRNLGEVKKLSETLKCGFIIDINKQSQIR